MSELPDPDSFGNYADWPGREVHGPGGRIGTVVEIYLDDATDRPEWVLVDLEEGSRFVPLAGGSVDAETIRVAHSSTSVERAPDLALSKELTQEQERQLYDHYAVPVSEEASDSLLPEADAEPAREPEPEPTQPLAAAPEPTPTPEPEPSPAPTPVVPVTEPVTEPAQATAPEPAAEPVAALPPEGETSEPGIQSPPTPPVPPRPEPVAPTPPPPAASPPPPFTEAQQSDSGTPPAAVFAGAAALAILLLIILRRRG